MARANGSMTRAIAKAPLTGTRGLLRSTAGGVQVKQPSRGRPSVAAQSRADRIYLEAAEIVEALTAGVVAGNPSRSEADVTALLVEASGVVKRSNRAAGVVQVVKACPQKGAVAPEVLAAEAAVVAVAAVEDDDKDWVKMFNIVNYKFDGGENDAY